MDHASRRLTSCRPGSAKKSGRYSTSGFRSTSTGTVALFQMISITSGSVVVALLKKEETPREHLSKSSKTTSSSTLRMSTKIGKKTGTGGSQPSFFATDSVDASTMVTKKPSIMTT